LVTSSGRPRALDLGCGDGRFTAELARAGADAAGVDVSAVALERARAAHAELDFRAPAAGGELPFEDSTFELVVCLDVLQHVADTQRLLSEARRVLAPGGALAVSVPWHGRLANVAVALGRFEREHDPLEPVLRHYTMRSLRSVLEQLGFERVELSASGGVPALRRRLHALARRG
jgi:SAM-dependent methyltransferase